MIVTKMRATAALLIGALSIAACLTVAACSPNSDGQKESGGAETTTAAAPGQFDPYVSDETCLSCHGGSYEAVAERTADYGDSNPHDSVHGGYLSCNRCHSNGSELTENDCLSCHDWPRDLQSAPN